MGLEFESLFFMQHNSIISKQIRNKTFLHHLDQTAESSLGLSSPNIQSLIFFSNSATWQPGLTYKVSYTAIQMISFSGLVLVIVHLFLKVKPAPFLISVSGGWNGWVWPVSSCNSWHLADFRQQELQDRW